MFQRSARTLAATSRSALQQNNAVAGRRWTSIETRGGKPKLLFRIGLKDIPVELYPLGFVVSMGVLGGLFASVRHLMTDKTLRLKRQGGSPQVTN